MIKPFPNKIFLKLETMKAGALDMTNQNMLSEIGEIIAVGINVNYVSIGDKVSVKVWGCDHCQIDGEDYYVVDSDSKALLCRIEDATA